MKTLIIINNQGFLFCITLTKYKIGVKWCQLMHKKTQKRHNEIATNFKCNNNFTAEFLPMLKNYDNIFWRNFYQDGLQKL